MQFLGSSMAQKPLMLAVCLLTSYLAIRQLLQSPPLTSAPTRPSTVKLSLEDLVIAVPLTVKRQNLIELNRAWRSNVTTLYAIEDPDLVKPWITQGGPYNEFFAYHPDYEFFPDNVTKHWGKGDRRAAVVPLLASAAFLPKCRWVLLADDDTIFFWPGLLKLLSSYNSDLPFIISDDIGPAPFPYDRRSISRVCDPCLPMFIVNSAGLEAADRCLCNRQRACQNRWYSDVLQDFDCKSSPIPGGGGGVAMSIGLFKDMAHRGITFDKFEACVNSKVFNTRGWYGGDTIMMQCLWDFDYAVTAATVPKHLKPLPGTTLFNGVTLVELLKATDELAAGDKSALQRHRLLDVVSIHMRHRQFKGVDEYGNILKQLSLLFDAFASMSGFEVDM